MAVARKLAVGVVVHCAEDLQSVLRREAQIPSNLHFPRAERWLNPVLQKRVLGVLRNEKDWELAITLLEDFFVASDERFQRTLSKAAEDPAAVGQVVESARAELGDDPLVEVFAGLIRWFGAEASRPEAAGALASDQAHEPEMDSEALRRFDARLLQLRALADRFADFRPPEAEECLEAFRAACLEQAAALFTLRQRAADAGTTLSSINSRGDFAAEQKRVEDLLAANERLEERSAEFFAGLCQAFASLRVEHRLPARQVEFEKLVRQVRKELASLHPAPAGLRRSLGGPLSAPAWLEWVWHQNGPAAGALFQTLNLHAPGLVELMGAVEWDALTWNSGATGEAARATENASLPVESGLSADG